MENEVWANCENCKKFELMNGRQYCNEFDVLGLPEFYRVDTNKKFCSLFSTGDKKIKKPNLENMELGTLYYYNTNKPERLLEDIDL